MCFVGRGRQRMARGWRRGDCASRRSFGTSRSGVRPHRPCEAQRGNHSRARGTDRSAPSGQHHPGRSQCAKDVAVGGGRRAPRSSWRCSISSMRIREQTVSWASGPFLRPLPASIPPRIARVRMRVDW